MTDWLRMTASEAEDHGYSPEHEHGPWTCPDCDAETQSTCETCHGEGEVCEEEED